MQGAKRKLDKEVEGLHERIEELTAENQKTARSKKKIQGEVSVVTCLLHYIIQLLSMLRTLATFIGYVLQQDCTSNPNLV